MNERDYKRLAEFGSIEEDGKAHKPAQPKLAASAEEIIAYFKGEIMNATPSPSWYDIYRYATDESEWYEQDRARLVSAGAELDAIEEAVRQSNFFDKIREVADIQMMNVCLQIAKENGIENPFAADYGTT